MSDKWTKESLKNRFSLADFIRWIYLVGGLKVFHLGIRLCSAFLLLTCKGSLLPLIVQGGPSGPVG